MSQTVPSFATDESNPGTSSSLDDRYGRGSRNRKRDRNIVVAVAAAFAVVLLAWVVWGALDGDNASLEARDTAHKVVDDHNVDITFLLTAPSQSRVQCVLQALNDEFTVVGWKIIEVEPGDTQVRSFQQSIKTTQRASTGVVKTCWLPAS